MKIPVHMLAFGGCAIREVDVPDSELVSPTNVIQGNCTLEQYILERTFYWGQNDFQPMQFPSVSVGDVIEYEGFHLIEPTGFTLLSPEEFASLKTENLNQMKRNRKHPSRCFSCGKIAVSPKLIEYDACVKSGGHLHYFHVKDLQILECAECHEQMFGGAADTQITNGLKLHLLECDSSCESPNESPK